MRLFPLVLLLAATLSAPAQWELQDSTTKADLRGIVSVGGGVAWASGTHGTVLRTEDGGYMWQSCSMPPGAEQLDFRGIQAFDANTAIVMSSGKGALSRIYKTTDGCYTWKLILTNPDADGFWDALMLDRQGKKGFLLGDPVNGRFQLWETRDRGNSWTRVKVPGLEAQKDEGAFAASNSSILLGNSAVAFVSGGPAGARIFTKPGEVEGFKSQPLPLKGGSASAGAFSIEGQSECCWVAVGGEYTKPDDSAGTAAYTLDGGTTWHAAQTRPHGYRSSVAYDAASKSWIAVGPNGTDVSTDDGKNWHAAHPDSALHQGADADRNWNAISLPLVVGPHGRIGRLNPASLSH